MSTATFDPETLRFNGDGLIPAIAQDAATGEVLMMAWMNAEAVRRTLKGATSGHHQALVSMRVDCDRDCLLMQVNQTGPACHTGRRSCFFTDVTDGVEIEVDVGTG